MSEEWSLGDTNKSIGYLLPFIGVGNQKYKDYWSRDVTGFPYNLLVNVFHACEEYPVYDRHIFLLYKKHSNAAFLVHEGRLTMNPNYAFKYDPDDVHRMFVFKIPDRFLDSFEKFKEGKFSKMSEEDKMKIITFNNFGNECLGSSPKVQQVIPGTLYKQCWKRDQIEEAINGDTPKREWVRLDRDSEYSSIPYPEKETFLNKYKLYV